MVTDVKKRDLRRDCTRRFDVWNRIARTKPDVVLDARYKRGTVGARNFIASNKTSLALDSTPDPGTQDFWFGGWVRIGSNSPVTIFATGTNANGDDGFRLRIVSSVNKTLQITLCDTENDAIDRRYTHRSPWMPMHW